MAYLDKNTGLIVPGSAGGSSVDTSDATASAADVSAGAVFYGASGRDTGTMPDVTATKNDNVVTVPAGRIRTKQTVTVGTAQAAKTYTPGTADQIIAAGKYLTGAQTIKGDANHLPENIKKNVSLFGITGTFEGGSSMEFYQCSDVDTVNKTWSGNKAVWSDADGYYFEETITTGMSYTSSEPTVGGIYSSDMSVSVEYFPGRALVIDKDQNTLYAVSSIQGAVDQVSGEALTNSNVGVTQQAFDFSDGEAFLDLPITDEAKWELSDFTLEICYTTTSNKTHSYPTMFASASAWTAGAFCLRFDNVGNSKVGFFWTGQGDPVFYGSNTIGKEDQFRHLAVCRKDDVITMYDNGKIVATVSNANTLDIFVSSSSGGRIRLGALDTSSAQYRGSIKWARISNTCRYTADFNADQLKRDVVFTAK